MINPIGRRALRRALDSLYLAGGWLAGLFLIGICVLMMLLSVGREIGINVKGGDEISAWFCAATAYLGLAYTFKTGDLVRVGLLIDRIPLARRRFLEVAILSLAALVTGYFAYFAVDLVWDSYRFKERAQGVIAIPIWIPQLGLAAGAMLFFVAMLDELQRVLRGLRPCYVPEPAKTIEEQIERFTHSGV
jgi:TRAP-type C4-dicarboxylate transport system permease small subunit